MALGIVAKKTGSKWLDFQKGAPRFGSDVIQLFRKDVCPILGYKSIPHIPRIGSVVHNF